MKTLGKLCLLSPLENREKPSFRFLPPGEGGIASITGRTAFLLAGQELTETSKYGTDAFPIHKSDARGARAPQLTATGCVLWFPLIPTPWLLTAASTPPSPLGEPPSEGDTPAAVVYSAGVTTSPSPSAGVGGGTMIMDGGLDALTPHHHHQSHPHHHHAFLLTENAAAAGHFNVLSFDTLYKEPPGGGGAASASPATPEPTPVGVEGEEAAQPGDLNTPVTTSGDIPSFFGPSTVVEPPPITVVSNVMSTQYIAYLDLHYNVTPIHLQEMTRSDTIQ
uniref:Uncharacterized protein n=1 Tax=Timema shepardi TaxID=629360 RepID=A0A7R9FWI6_TIMSH|nr:unnamed protein product [Timema shepardi]